MTRSTGHGPTLGQITAAIPSCPLCKKDNFLVETRRQGAKTYVQAVRCSFCGEDILSLYLARPKD